MMLSPSTVHALKFKLFERFDISNLRRHRYQQENGNNNNNELGSSTSNNGNECDSIEWQTITTMVGCLLFALISGLLASLFAIEHLINMLGIGTLLMMYGITMDILILR